MNNERYSRQIRLKDFGENAQQKLRTARVLVIGAGGLGCPALQYLVAGGVGFIGIIDNDVVSLSNLHRQILYNTHDIGKLKVEVAAEKLKLLNPDTEIFAYNTWLDQTNVLDLFRSYDFILDGTDNFESRYLINDACVFLNKALVFAAVSGYEGQLAVFNVTDERGSRTNYRDLFPIPPKPGEVANCEENGVLGVLPGIIGTMAAAEMIKLITGKGELLSNKLLQYNLLNQGSYTLVLSPGKQYSMPKNEEEFLTMHKNEQDFTKSAYTEIDILEMLRLQNSANAVVIDVRERHEFPRLNGAQALQVPMSEFEDFMDQDIVSKDIILLCQHGIRSVAAAELLSEKYGHTKNIYSLKGGISKWRNHFIIT